MPFNVDFCFCLFFLIFFLWSGKGAEQNVIFRKSCSHCSKSMVFEDLKKAKVDRNTGKLRFPCVFSGGGKKYQI